MNDHFEDPHQHLGYLPAISSHTSTSFDLKSYPIDSTFFTMQPLVASPKAKQAPSRNNHNPLNTCKTSLAQLDSRSTQLLVKPVYAPSVQTLTQKIE